MLDAIRTIAAALLAIPRRLEEPSYVRSIENAREAAAGTAHIRRAHSALAIHDLLEDGDLKRWSA